MEGRMGLPVFPRRLAGFPDHAFSYALLRSCLALPVRWRGCPARSVYREVGYSQGVMVSPWANRPRSDWWPPGRLDSLHQRQVVEPFLGTVLKPKATRAHRSERLSIVQGSKGVWPQSDWLAVAIH